MNITCYKCGKSFEVTVQPSEIHTKAFVKSTQTFICPHCGASNVVESKE